MNSEHFLPKVEEFLQGVGEVKYLPKLVDVNWRRKKIITKLFSMVFVYTWKLQDTIYC